MNDPSVMGLDDPNKAGTENAGDWSLRIHRLKLVARRLWWIPMLTVGAGLGIMDYVALHEVPRYTSTSRMIESGHLALTQGEIYSEEAATFFGTQVALMKSPTNIARAIEEVSTAHPDITPDEKAGIDANVEPKSSIFNLSVTSKNPDYSKYLLDAIMDSYLNEKQERKNQTSDDARAGMTEEITRLNSDIQNDEQALLNFQKENDMVFIEEQSASSAAHLVELNSELASLMKERDLMALAINDDRLNALTEGTLQPTNTGTSTPGSTEPDGSKTDMSNSASADLSLAQDTITKLKILRDQLGLFLKDKHPKMIDLADQIDREQKFIDDLKSRDLATLNANRTARRELLELQIQNVQKQFETAKAASVKLSASLGTYQQLKGKLARDETLYSQLALNIHNVDLTKSVGLESVVILEAASKAIPYNDFVQLLLIGSLAGLGVGLILVYLVNRLDNKVDSALELTEAFGLPIIGQIPYVRPDKKSKRVKLIEETDPRHVYVEHLCNLRSAILFRSFQVAKLKSIMVCSAAPGEGKSTLSANLALVLAHAGLHVLLIDADLRRGSLHSHFQLKASPGLSNYLRNEISWREAVQATNLPNLGVMTCGDSSRWAGDLLLSSSVDVLAKESTQEYDIVLWDSVPLLAAHDAANLCSKVDGVLFLARFRRSSLNAIQSSLEDLLQRKAHVLGFVLNAVQHAPPGYFYKYKYKEYYEAPAATPTAN